MKKKECPFCHKIFIMGDEKSSTICPNCKIGLPKGSCKEPVIHKTSFNPGGDKAFATDIQYEG